MSEQEQQSGQGPASRTEAVGTSRRDFLRKSAAGVGAAVAAGASATAPLEIKAPEARDPRAKPAPKIRGRDDYAGSVQRATPNPRAREHD